MKLDDVVLWLLSLFGGLAMIGARLGWQLFGIAVDPPVDPVAFDLWRRKRKWLVISEISALPVFATVSVLVGKLRHWPMEGVILLSMVLGALGFAFLFDALSFLVRQRIGMPETPAKDETL